MKESDRCKLLVCDAIDTMSRMNDRTMLQSAKGIQDHVEELLLNGDDGRDQDLITSALVVILAILEPISEQMLATTDGRYIRSKVGIDSDLEDDQFFE
tara:strand:+ start:14 stop:307 length:294 start_codon:yes stop_codon:yes gene_type:complete